ncbi:hypothetical protein GPECTOR_3g299 [Gonium pectorale]|uniref:Uncharacterized protein n=1 Tax=Gonium pectorale TaxID=33097 RepID=A0A150GZ70_GONPE|nr:hypothetical protein GPECTOR_3g299 [Gonium pectorale]|eukprot:KXZ55149.1 hypothetical protein GPECTOR_3g299 [Gonium pectorale]
MGMDVMKLYAEIEESLLRDVQEKRVDRNAARERLENSRGAQGLQARGVLMFVYSTPDSSFRDFLADSPEYVNLPTFGANPSNAIPGSTMLALASEMAERVERGASGAGVAPNATLLGEQLDNVLKLKAMWGKRLLPVTLLMIRHPVCGRMAAVQPLLGAACMARLTNWSPDLDPVFEVLLQAGASPRVRNSLNMTPLMLLAVALVNELDKAQYVTQASNPEAQAAALNGDFSGAIQLAVLLARKLLAAGADPRDPIRGFGKPWAEMDDRVRDAALPSYLRPTKQVLGMESYTAATALEAMLLPHADVLAAASPGVRERLSEFQRLLLQGAPPGDQAPERTGQVGQSAAAEAAEAVPIGREAAPGAADASPSADFTLAAGDDGDPGCSTTKSGTIAEAPGRDGSGAVTDESTVVPAAGQPGADAAEPAEVEAQPDAEARQPEKPLTLPGVTWPWVQAMSNIAWAVSQVTMGPTATARRTLLRHLVRQAPFELPGMTVVSVEQLREAGCIPRYTVSQDPVGVQAPATVSSAFQPLPVESLPAGSVVVFVSHRWLGRGCPDDDVGTKLKQVFLIADYVAGLRGVPLSAVYLWLDYSVVDQSNPMPGALPIYIACCDEFVYVEHEEYWQRAWCLTEQFMHWKLASSESKHALSPLTETIRAESARQRPPDPTYGKLAVEADRVALATMTSIMPYDDD